MSETTIERSLTVDTAESGHAPLTVAVNDSTIGHMPVSISRGNYTIYLRLSEWDEVRDHVEYCMTLVWPEPAETGPGLSYVTCDDGPGLVPYEPLPCVLERGHDRVPSDRCDDRHCDRLGRRW